MRSQSLVKWRLTMTKEINKQFESFRVEESAAGAYMAEKLVDDGDSDNG